MRLPEPPRAAAPDGDKAAGEPERSLGAALCCGGGARQQPFGFPPGCWRRPYLAAALGRQVP